MNEIYFISYYVSDKDCNTTTPRMNLDYSLNEDRLTERLKAYAFDARMKGKDITYYEAKDDQSAMFVVTLEDGGKEWWSIHSRELLQ